MHEYFVFFTPLFIDTFIPAHGIPHTHRWHALYTQAIAHISLPSFF